MSWSTENDIMFRFCASAGRVDGCVELRLTVTRQQGATAAMAGGVPYAAGCAAEHATGDENGSPAAVGWRAPETSTVDISGNPAQFSSRRGRRFATAALIND